MEKAFSLIEDYETFEDLTFSRGFLDRLQTSAYQRMGRNKAAEDSLKLSEIYDQEPRHFMTGSGTYVLSRLEGSEVMIP
jgi:hypothetical protein